MKPTRRQFLQTSALATLAATQRANARDWGTQRDPLDAFEIAGHHRIVRDIPTPNFFEGMLLGNGDVGVCVVVRPDALGLYLGKNDCWDIRMTEDQQVAPFPEVLKMWRARARRQSRKVSPT